MTDNEIRKEKIYLVCKILTDYRKKNPEDYRLSAAICAAVQALDYADESGAHLSTLKYVMLGWEEEKHDSKRTNC